MTRVLRMKGREKQVFIDGIEANPLISNQCGTPKLHSSRACKEPVCELVNEPASELVNEPVRKLINELVCELVNEPVHELKRACSRA